MSLKKQLLLPATAFGASLVALTALMLLTSPVNRIGYAIVFFAILLISLVSLGFLFMGFWGAKNSAKNRFRIFIVSIFLVISLMFRSSQSLNWIDGLIVALVVFGLLFYGGRRF